MDTDIQRAAVLLETTNAMNVWLTPFHRMELQDYLATVVFPSVRACLVVELVFSVG